MGLEVFEEYNTEVSEYTTISELIDELGEKAVIRGIKYMYSLSDADKKYRRSVSNTDFAKDYAEGIMDEDVDIDEDKADEINKKWENESSKKGLDMDNE